MMFHVSNCIDQDADYIYNKLVEYNFSQIPKTQDPAFKNIHKKIVDESGNIVAGCLAVKNCWNILGIDILWVDEKYRKSGLGSKLLKTMEEIAVEENCTLIYLDTFDFQAKDFYLKHGYEIFGVLEDCPENHKRYYLKKKLK